MKAILFLFASTLVACSPPALHSWMIKDQSAGRCWVLHERALVIDSQVHWKDQYDQEVATSNRFDLRVFVEDDGSKRAAIDSMKINLLRCSDVPAGIQHRDVGRAR